MVIFFPRLRGHVCVFVWFFFFFGSKKPVGVNKLHFWSEVEGELPPRRCEYNWLGAWVGERLRPPDILNTHVAVCDDLLICYTCVHMLRTLSRGLTATCVMCYKLFTGCWAKTSVVTYTFWVLNANFLTVQHSHRHFVRFFDDRLFPAVRVQFL